MLVGLGVMVAYFAEAAVSDWSGVYLRETLDSSKAVAPLALGAYLGCQVVGRAGADRLVQGMGAGWTVTVGSLVGVAGMVLAAVAWHPAVAIAGFALVGGGLSVLVPLAFSTAGALDRAGSGVAVARVNLFNYAGFVAGVGVVGAVADGVGLRAAFAVPAVLALGGLALAPSFNAEPGGAL